MKAHAWLLLVGVGLCSFASGCSLCAHPYDYCGSNCIGDACYNCGWCSRVGSAFSGPGAPHLVDDDSALDADGGAFEEVTPGEDSGYDPTGDANLDDVELTQPVEQADPASPSENHSVWRSLGRRWR